MAAAKEIRTKIKSIKSTQKITRAMEMVAASKMRKAQTRMFSSRPYADKINVVINHLAEGNSEYRHSYLIPREVKRVGLIIISTDRGLCGGLNINLFRSLLKQLEDWKSQSIEHDLCVIGSKAEGFFKRLGSNFLASKTHLGDKPLVQDVIGPVKVMLEAFDNNQIDALYIAHNKFVNTMSQDPIIEKLLPIVPEQTVSKSSEDNGKPWDYIYEPSAKELLDELLTRYIEAQVYQGLVENFACEQAARMVAMKSATDNAGQLIDELQLAYNKARQAAITQELSEIVAGAAAV